MEIFPLSCRAVNNRKRTPHRDVPYTVGRLITTEDQSLKQQDALPCYLFCKCKVSTMDC